MNLSDYIRFEDYCTEKASEENINHAELKICFKLPKLFKEIVKACDEGSVINSHFDYYNPYDQSIWGNGIGSFLSLKLTEKHNLIDKYFSPPEGFPKNAVAFAGTGGGDYICFDYRHDPTTDNPPVVFWLHEENEGEDVIFLAPTFEDFLKMLKEPED